jgi:hypothetical protein
VWAKEETNSAACQRRSRTFVNPHSSDLQGFSFTLSLVAKGQEQKTLPKLHTTMPRQTVYQLHPFGWQNDPEEERLR